MGAFGALVQRTALGNARKHSKRAVSAACIYLPVLHYCLDLQ